MYCSICGTVVEPDWNRLVLCRRAKGFSLFAFVSSNYTPVRLNLSDMLANMVVRL